MHNKQRGRTERYQDLAQLYCEKATFVYLLLEEGRWYNGYIESVQGSILMFKDRFLDEPIPIFINEIRKLEPSNLKATK